MNNFRSFDFCRAESEQLITIIPYDVDKDDPE